MVRPMKPDLKPLIPLEKLKNVVADLAAVPKSEVDLLESERPKKRRKPKKAT